MTTATLTRPVISVEVKEQILGVGRRKQVGILGGTFDPPHLGHLMMAEQVRAQLGLEKILFLPDATPPHVDQKFPEAADHRLAMVKLAIANNPLFELDLTDINAGGISYTYNTMLRMKEAHPDTDYYFIIGGDMVAYLHKWYRIDDLLKLVTFVGVKRPGYPVTSKYPVLFVDAPTIDLSSTLIRQKVAQGCSIKYLVPDTVADYIYEKGLYVHDTHLSH